MPEAAARLQGSPKRGRRLRHGRYRHLLGLFVGLYALLPALASAEKQSTGTAPTKPRVLLAIVGTAARYDALHAALSQVLLNNHGLTFEHLHSFDPHALIESSSQRSARVSAWADLSHPTVALLYFTNQHSNRFLIRKLSVSAAFNEVDRETVAQALELSIALLLEDDAAGYTRAQARSVLADAEREVGAEPEKTQGTRAPAKDADVRPASGAPTPNPEPLAEAHTAVAAFYAVRLHSSAYGLMHGAGVGLTHHRPWSGYYWGAGALAWYEPAQHYTSDLIGLGLQSVNLRVVLEASSSEAPDTAALGLRLGVGADLVRLEPEAGAADGATPGDPRSSSAWVVSLALLGRQPLFGKLSVFAALGIEFDPAEVHYDVLTAETQIVVVSRYRMRPGAFLGLRL